MRPSRACSRSLGRWRREASNLCGRRSPLRAICAMNGRDDDMPDCPVTLTAGLVSALVQQQFPPWANRAVTPIEPGGWDNRTFRLGDDLLVRLPSHARYAAQVEKEQRWLPVLAPQLPLPIPAPVGLGVPGAGYPWPWSVYRWLPGEAASPENISDIGDLARALAKFLRALYHVDASGGPPAGEHNFFRG